MTGHLSSEQIASSTLGETNDPVEQHLSQCAACRSEVANFKLALASFRETVHDWADEHMAPPDQTIRRIRLAPYRSALYQVSALAATGLLCLFALLGLQHDRTVAIASPSVVDDAVLLQSVEKNLSDHVPTALVPLETLGSWETGRSARTR